jgi:UDP-N-acetylmuramate--alanine ligase
VQKIDLHKVQTVHFVGIGGIGISAIARMMLLAGKRVSGSDGAESKVTEELKKAGATLYVGHRADQVPEGCDLVVYTIAVPSDNPERAEAVRRKIPSLSYPEMLGLVSAHKYTIAISGTHGKTTTTAMVAKVLMDAKKDPTVIVGSFLKDVQSNFVAGKSEYFVVEACEYRRSFLNLSPKILVITNIDNDHLDYYKDVADIVSAFNEIARKVPKDGFIICNPNGPHMHGALLGVTAKIVDYTTYGKNPRKLLVPGKHNQINASAVSAVSAVLGLTSAHTEGSLSQFSGTWRRFEYKGQTKSGAQVYDDYGHHPTEIKATLAGARELFPGKKIIAVFQPHLFSRTKLLFADFTNAFSDADVVLLAPIYAAREVFDPSVTSEALALAIGKTGKEAFALDSFGAIIDQLSSMLSKDTVVLTIGAGDVYQVGEQLLRK